MKIEPVTCIWMFVCVINFWAARNGKIWSFGLFRPNLRELGLFHPYFVCKYSFREISMIKIVISDQSKLISLYLKKEIQNSRFINCMFIIHKSGNKTSIQPILKSNSTSFMFNNIFCEKKGIRWGGLGEMGELSYFPLENVITVFTWISRCITWISK